MQSASDSSAAPAAAAAAAASPAAVKASPAGFTKEAYRAFKAAAQTYVKKVEMEQKVRKNLQLSGVCEPLDSASDGLVAAAKERFRQARIALNEQQNRAAACIEQTLRAPLAHIDDDGRLRDESDSAPAAPPRLPSDADLSLLSARSSHLSSLVSSLHSSLPVALQSCVEEASFMESRANAPASDELRAILRRVTADLAKQQATAAGGGRRNTRKSSATRAAEAEEKDATGSGGKVKRQPSARLSARIAAKPY